MSVSAIIRRGYMIKQYYFFIVMNTMLPFKAKKNLSGYNDMKITLE